MNHLKDFFDFTSGQLRIISALSALALVLSGYLLIRSYAVNPQNERELGIFTHDRGSDFTGVFVVDPNSSPADSLELLPGIGKVLADRIVAYRQHNRFETEEDITRVKGIGPGLYIKLRPYLKVYQP
ncbi:MAG: helix-hairpin-helix domain-containing protein [candidate division Zixibacteria bacterium]|nr:helix-hairpin-helix domain-containing protein [candidate division Zixibacteria bacterium]MDD5426740.1 helix-hairpin-helix domain-containing protein [candidate division Zixibacteria bacterium]